MNRRLKNFIITVTLVFVLSITSLVLAGMDSPVSPGNSYNSAYQLGFTEDFHKNEKGENGIVLESVPNGRDGKYYFYFSLENEADVDFTFWTPMPLTLLQSLSGTADYIVSVFDHEHELVDARSSRARDVEYKLDCWEEIVVVYDNDCTVELQIDDLERGNYFVVVDFGTPDSLDDRDYLGWLSWDLQKPSGKAAKDALPWYGSDQIYGELGAEHDHWYKLNLSAGQKIAITLWAADNADVAINVYSANQMKKATDAITYLTTEDGSSERTTFTIPDSSETYSIYIQVFNYGRSNADYWIQLALSD
jgi:hypothetical protein